MGKLSPTTTQSVYLVNLERLICTGSILFVWVGRDGAKILFCNQEYVYTKNVHPQFTSINIRQWQLASVIGASVFWETT